MGSEYDQVQPEQTPVEFHDAQTLLIAGELGSEQLKLDIEDLMNLRHPIKVRIANRAVAYKEERKALHDRMDALNVAAHMLTRYGAEYERVRQEIRNFVGPIHAELVDRTKHQRP